MCQLKNALPLAKHLNVLIAVRYESSQIKQPLIVKVKNDFLNPSLIKTRKI